MFCTEVIAEMLYFENIFEGRGTFYKKKYFPLKLQSKFEKRRMRKLPSPFLKSQKILIIFSNFRFIVNLCTTFDKNNYNAAYSIITSLSGAKEEIGEKEGATAN